ncbi:helix-turn-helix transcriptional regulator [Sphingobacterium thalpophilum]|uniref:Helix-turn-helix transcriptional regulator n=1 Tax=Sphingobacterium thalpophilum TaxID=259 RepID=A0ABV4HBM3_9SPHI|nr:MULTISPECIES: helix-turn-helix transcriptional regulator [Sphingobacterium]MCW8313714.1 helix-turn-helix transcriptional regulator [Sphingobacterium sp. InxBP1]
MKYKEIKPAPILAPYIHTFWELIGEEKDSQWERNFPDGCGGVVINLGDTCITDNGTTKMDFGKTYAVGATTSFKDSFVDENIHLFGVCLKPGVFPNFYDYSAQSEIVDTTVQLDHTHSFHLDKFLKNPVGYLNEFFAHRLHPISASLESALKTIHQAQGQITIDEIAKRNFTSVRQLERKFKTHVGVSPKEYTRIIRFQNALSKIKEPNQRTSLLNIAFECGYYDHAHLTNDFKKHTGMSPSKF